MRILPHIADDLAHGLAWVETGARVRDGHRDVIASYRAHLRLGSCVPVVALASPDCTAGLSTRGMELVP